MVNLHIHALKSSSKIEWDRNIDKIDRNIDRNINNN